MKRANYFHDGYTQEGFVTAVPLVHGELRFTYRPAMVEERSQLNDAAKQLKSSLYDRHAAIFTAQKLVHWDLADAHDSAVPVSADALLRLQPDLFSKLHRIVAGWIPSDVDPDWCQEVQNDQYDFEIDAALNGRLVSDIREEHDEKN